VTVSAANCTFTAGGSIDGTFNTTTQTLTPSNTGNRLKITNAPSGAICTALHLAQNDVINTTVTLPIVAAAGAITIS
jgi:hypothetical protein